MKKLFYLFFLLPVIPAAILTSRGGSYSPDSELGFIGIPKIEKPLTITEIEKILKRKPRSNEDEDTGPELSGSSFRYSKYKNSLRAKKEELIHWLDNLDSSDRELMQGIIKKKRWNKQAPKDWTKELAEKLLRKEQKKKADLKGLNTRQQNYPKIN